MTTIVRALGNLIVATTEKVDVRLAGVDVTKAPLYVDVPSGTPCAVVYFNAMRGYETVSHDGEIAQTQGLEDLAAEAEEAQKDGPRKLSKRGRPATGRLSVRRRQDYRSLMRRRSVSKW